MILYFNVFPTIIFTTDIVEMHAGIDDSGMPIGGILRLSSNTGKSVRRIASNEDRPFNTGLGSFEETPSVV